MKKILSFLIIFSLLPLNNVFSETVTFQDINNEFSYKEALDYLKENNIVKGYDDGNFKPFNRINRAEFTKILVESTISKDKIEKCTKSYFKDVKKEDWFFKYVCSAKENKIIDGYPDGTFGPEKFINFAESAKIISETFKLSGNDNLNKEWYEKYVERLGTKKAIPVSIDNVDKNITRGEMSEMVWRIKTNNQTKSSQNLTKLTNSLPTFDSCSKIEDKIEQISSRQNYNIYSFGIDEAVPTQESEAPTSAPSMDSSAGNKSTLRSRQESSSDYSKTNVQVEGVDEADIIKNDGEYIYTIKNQTIRIIKAYPPKDMKEVAKIDLGESDFYPSEMFVSGDKLIVIGSSSYFIGVKPLSSDEGVSSPDVSNKMAIGIMPPYFNNTKTRVITYDIKDRSKPVIFRRVSHDGNYLSSRRIGDQVYVVINQNNFYPIYYRGFEKSGETKTFSDILPKFQNEDKAPTLSSNCNSIRYIPGFNQPNILSVVSFDIKNKSNEPKRFSMFGSGENIYVSDKNMYIASTSYADNFYTDWNWQVDSPSTNIYKFGLDNGNINFSFKGKVNGTILNQFSMDENANFFRIATTSRRNWNEPKNNVYVLNNSMQTVGKLENLAPTEQIYSTRFMGDRLYMVTFRQVDPLFVIDLSKPTNPKVLGELKIPGFSNYLHPYDQNHIIGFGQDATEDGRTTGMKIGLFDVSDVKNPKEKFSTKLGDQGTYSELLYNHKALLFDKEKNLLAFPVNITTKMTLKDENKCGDFTYSSCPSTCNRVCRPSTCNADGICTSDCDGANSCQSFTWNTERYETTFVGAIVFDIDITKGFKERGRITNFTKEEITDPNSGYPYNFEKAVQRIIYIGNYLYTISPGFIKSVTMDKIETVGNVEMK